MSLFRSEASIAIIHSPTILNGFGWGNAAPSNNNNNNNGNGNNNGMKRQNIRTLALIVCTFTYLLIGASVFDALESPTEQQRCESLQDIERLIKLKYNITEEDYMVLETVVVKYEPFKAGRQWKFAGSFYFATTVLTTIGYGHSTPSTTGGKLFTMCYAVVGIPLGLIMFQSIGERLNKCSSQVIRRVKIFLKCKNVEASELNLICVVTTLSSLTITGGAAAFSKYEGWSYFDSVYYCFITLTTIGFGDMVALQKDHALEKKPEYVVFALIFILFGLAIVAASLNLLVLRFVTMNTEDERRDEAEALQANHETVRLDGDIITGNGSIITGRMRGETSSLGDRVSVCSCTCKCFPKFMRNPNNYPARQSPTEMIPLQDFSDANILRASTLMSRPRAPLSSNTFSFSRQGFRIPAEALLGQREMRSLSADRYDSRRTWSI